MVRSLGILAGLSGIALAGMQALRARAVAAPADRETAENWAIGFLAAAIVVLCVAVFDWSAFAPDTIQLPFVNER